MIIAVLPVVILLYYFWYRDRGEKEPMKLMRKVFIWGILVIAPIIVIEMLLEDFALSFISDPIVFLLVSNFLLVALPEELAKFTVVKKAAYNHHKFNEVMDGITYAILASMGFAIAENVLYTINYGIEIGYLRSITAVPAHALFSGIMGYYIGQAKFTQDKKKKKALFLKGICAAIFFHGLYNFMLSTEIAFVQLSVFLLIFYMFTVLNRAIKLAHKDKMSPLRYI